MSAAGFPPDGALPPSLDETATQLVQTAETRALWERYAAAKQRAEDSLLSGDGLAAAQAFYAFVEAFMPQVYGAGVVPLNLRRRADATVVMPAPVVPEEIR